MKNYSRKQLLELPHRNWSETSFYSSLIVFPSNWKHDSGWGCITVIGCIDGKPIEVVTQSSDDLHISGAHRIDCLHKAKAMHFWSRHARFKVTHALSSMDIEMVCK